MDKVYCIKKIWISDGMPEVDVDIFKTQEARDEAWNHLVHDHNNCIQDAYDIRLSDDDYECDYYYEWDNEELEFYCKEDASMHHDYFVKSEEVIYE